jgi:hypothetical protein
MGDEHAADKEREMREHEREARERDPAERRPAGEDDDTAAENPAPPASAGEGNISGS